MRKANKSSADGSLNDRARRALDVAGRKRLERDAEKFFRSFKDSAERAAFQRAARKSVSRKRTASLKGN